jgi:hypothetical protein
MPYITSTKNRRREERRRSGLRRVSTVVLFAAFQLSPSPKQAEADFFFSGGHLFHQFHGLLPPWRRL